jgi:hypothetical protein
MILRAGSRSVTRRPPDAERSVASYKAWRLARERPTISSRGGVVVVSPRGTGQFSIIGDHLSYLMVHIDPGKSVPRDLS